MQKHRIPAIVGLVATAALSIAACGSSAKTSTPAAPAAGASTTPSVTVDKLTGTQTAVTLDTDTVAALTKLGVKVTGFGTAHQVMLDDGAALAFPITGGNVKVYPPTVPFAYVQGEVDHMGSGLTLTAGTKSVTVSDFVINPGTSMLTATLGGKAGFPLFFLDGSNLKITPVDKTYHLDGTKVELLPSAATALDMAFGVAAGTVPAMAEIGIAHIVAS